MKKNEQIEIKPKKANGYLEILESTLVKRREFKKGDMIYPTDGRTFKPWRHKVQNGVKLRENRQDYFLPDDKAALHRCLMDWCNGTDWVIFKEEHPMINKMIEVVARCDFCWDIIKGQQTQRGFYTDCIVLSPQELDRVRFLKSEIVPNLTEI